MIKKTLSLKHDFTESEINEIAHTLTDCLQQKGQVVIEKQQANKNFNSTLKYWDRQIEEQSMLISDGYTYRDTDCEVVYNAPVAGQKTITRIDTDESWTEPMMTDEFDLFNNMNVPTDPSTPLQAKTQAMHIKVMATDDEEE